LSRGRRAADDPIEASARADEPAHVAHRVPNITAVRRDDDLVAALAARRAGPNAASDMAEVTAAAGDDAIRLLRALIADVDAGAPVLPAGSRTAGTGAASVLRGTPRCRRRTRVFVSLGVATMVLTSTGVAAAGGGIGGAGGVIARFAQPADERPHRESRAGPRRASEPVDGQGRGTARTSPDAGRQRHWAPRGPRAAGPAGEESRPRVTAPSAPPWFPQPEVQPRVPEPGDLQRTARTEAENELDGLRSRWPGR
jgi:hypothetical protein